MTYTGEVAANVQIEALHEETTVYDQDVAATQVTHSRRRLLATDDDFSTGTLWEMSWGNIWYAIDHDAHHFAGHRQQRCGSSPHQDRRRLIGYLTSTEVLRIVSPHTSDSQAVSLSRAF